MIDDDLYRTDFNVQCRGEFIMSKNFGNSERHILNLLRSGLQFTYNCIILTLYLQPYISPTLFLSVLHIIHILRLFQPFRGQIRVTNRREKIIVADQPTTTLQSKDEPCHLHNSSFFHAADIQKGRSSSSYGSII